MNVLGEEKSVHIHREIADKGRANGTIDSTRESIRRRLMVLVRRAFNRYGYPPDLRPRAIHAVMKRGSYLLLDF